LNQIRLKYENQIRFVRQDYPVIPLLSPKGGKPGSVLTNKASFGNSTMLFMGLTGLLKRVILKSTQLQLD
jgi:hypothetical protein